MVDLMEMLQMGDDEIAEELGRLAHELRSRAPHEEPGSFRAYHRAADNVDKAAAALWAIVY